MPNYSQESALSSMTTINGTVIDQHDPSLKLALTIARAADDRKGEDICLLRVTDVSSLADYFVIITGFSRVQVRGIARAIEAAVEEQLQRSPTRTEGQAESAWVLQDYGDVIVHILMPQERDFYNLEAFWGHGDRLKLADFVES